jgi:hypothetical protein
MLIMALKFKVLFKLPVLVGLKKSALLILDDVALVPLPDRTVRE